MTADLPVEPFEAFPEEFHVRRETHVASVMQTWRLSR